MRKLASLAVPAVVIFSLGVLSGCKGVENPAEHSRAVVKGRTVANGQPIQSDVIVVWGSKEVTTLVTGPDGYFTVEGKEPPAALIGATTGQTGYAEGPFLDETEVVLSIAPLPKAAGEGSPAKTLGEYWFGVYDTDSNGDVRFRYRYNFSRYVCVNYLPWFPWANPNPNTWNGWDVNSFPSPWKGKKLLVPRTFQYWHRSVYGYSISNALYLIANG